MALDRLRDDLQDSGVYKDQSQGPKITETSERHRMCQEPICVFKKQVLDSMAMSNYCCFNAFQVTSILDRLRSGAFVDTDSRSECHPSQGGK
ncbi:hypothetical protein BGZ51_003978 [Haplosporangium sp. Z 767]|nr:hypothetical protein BGZ51_003978 [Haplosporangium sp. Z 767]